MSCFGLERPSSTLGCREYENSQPDSKYSMCVCTFVCVSAWFSVVKPGAPIHAIPQYKHCVEDSI